MLAQTNQDGSVVKIKRQLQFDSALYARNSEEQEQSMRPTPQSLKTLLNSERQMSEKKEKHEFDSAGAESVIQLSDLKVKHSTPDKDREDNDGQVTPKTKGE